MSPQLLLIMGGGASLTLLLLILLLKGDDSSSQLQKRLERVGGTTPLKPKEQTGSLRRSTMDSGIPFLDHLIKATLPNPDQMRARLARTGRNIAISEYLMVNALAILVFFLIFVYAAHLSKVMSIFLGIAVGLYLPHMITGRMGNKRIDKFLASFPEAIDTICRGLRSGLPIAETIAAVGHELPDPIGIEFTRISDGVRMGRSLEESMWEVAKRLDSADFRFFIIALAIQRETGGNLAETLGNLGDLLRKRRQLKLKVKAMSSEARASAMIIGSLPFIMFTLLMVVNSDYVMTLFRDPSGNVLLGGGLFWLSLGVFVMKQMVNFEI